MKLLGTCIVTVAALIMAIQFVPTSHAERGAADRPIGDANDVLGNVAAPADDDAQAGGSGADVIVGSLPNAQYWGQSGSLKAYSIATTSCNEGNVNLNWFQGGLNHPVIAQNVYRYQVLPNGVGRFEQIGMSWLKHGFCALQGNVCGGCSPVCGGCCSQLGPGCSDPYGASLNGNWSDLGPRSEVNPTTGDYLWPHALASGNSTIRGRAQIEAADLIPGAQYFFEGHYIALDDATAGNGRNNASWRQANLSGNNLNSTGSTIREEPAIHAWKAMQPNVVDRLVSFNSGTGDPNEYFNVSFAVTDLGDGTWNYEYAVHNLQSDRAGAGYSVEIPAGTNITNIDLNMINHHSGEPYSQTPWTGSFSGSDVTWSVVDEGTNSNALRWGTMFNFRFDADQPPVLATATLDLFKAGTPSEVSFQVLGPDGPMDKPCPGDTNGDNVINIDDIVNVVLDFGCTQPPACPNGGDVNGDDVVNIDDVVFTVLNFGNVCP